MIHGELSILIAEQTPFGMLQWAMALVCLVGGLVWYLRHVQEQIDRRNRELEIQLTQKLAKLDPEWEIAAESVDLRELPFWSTILDIGPRGRPFISRTRNGRRQWGFHHFTTLLAYQWHGAEYDIKSRAAVAIIELSQEGYEWMTAYNKRLCKMLPVFGSDEGFNNVPPGWYFASSGETVGQKKTVQLMLEVLGDADYGNLMMVEIRYGYVVLYAEAADLKSFLGLTQELDRLQEFV